MDDKMPVPVEPRDLSFRQVQTAYLAESGERPHQAGAGLLSVLLRAWKKVLIVTLVLCAIGLPSIWFGIPPEFVAQSAIKVDPVSKAIAFEDRAGTMPFYTNYLRTQADLIMSWRVLNPVVQDGEVIKQAFFKTVDDPITYLKEHLVATPGQSSQHIYVEMSCEDAQTAAAIANAAVRAYMKIEGGSEATSEDEKLRTLERERDGASEKLRNLYEAAYQLGEEFGATDLTAQQQVMLEKVKALQEHLAQIQSTRLMLEIQVNALKGGQGGQDEASLAELRSSAIKNDPVVSYLTAQVAQREQEFSLAKLTKPVGSRPLKEMEDQLNSYRSALDMAKEKAKKEFDDLQREAKGAKEQHELAGLAGQLEQVKAQEAFFQGNIDKENSSVVALGRKSLTLKKIQDEIELTRDLYQRYTQRVQEVQLERQRPARVTVAWEADVPTKPDRDKRWKYCIVMALGALVFSCAFAVFQKEVDPRVETPSEVEARCDLRVLGTTPRFKDLDRKKVKAKHFVDDCRTIRVNLMLAAGEKQARTLVVASPQGRDGKTTLAINLATSIALTGKRVLLVDGDLRKPEVARYLKINNKIGLMNVLSGEVPLEDAVQKTILSTLEILPSNRRAYQQSELVGGPGLTEVLTRARMLYDEIIIDTPAVLAMPDAKLWATLADGVILVARSAKTGAKDLLEAKKRLQQTGARILGVVITGVRMADSYEKYQHRYGEGYVDEPVSEDDISATRVFLLSRTLGSDEEGASPAENGDGGKLPEGQ